jgi:hypothetical protein
MLFLCERVVGRTDHKKCDEKENANSTEMRAWLFHVGKADVMPRMSAQVEHGVKELFRLRLLSEPGEATVPIRAGKSHASCRF